jgi:acyl-homoserine lactone acylase PvdQ
MKAKDFEDFKKTLELKANNSTNTMYADDKGNIAYWHGNFIPVRGRNLECSAPLDGTTSATEWKGLHTLEEMIHIINPAKGFLQNCNSTPFSVSGFQSIPAANYPIYMAPDEENFRSLFAIKELESENSFTIDKLITAGYNTYLTAFDSLLPPLFEAYNNLPASHPYKQDLSVQIQLLKEWDKKSSVSSVATTLAILWAYTLFAEKSVALEKGKSQIETITAYSKRTAPERRLQLLHTLVKDIKRAFGTSQLQWGEINRYQRISGSINPSFDNSRPSIPVDRASSLFGCLPGFETQWLEGKSYGVAGNSFVAAIEFGDSVKAKAISTGGQFFQPSDKHFNDQSLMYAEGKFRDVYFYKDDVLKHKERQYFPGEK